MDYEVIFWVASAVIGMVGFCAMLYLGKKGSENYIDLEEWQ